jgi:hypothetical protein
MTNQDQIFQAAPVPAAFASFKQSFKVVRKGNPREGQTRPAIDVIYAPVLAVQVADYPAEQVATILNDALVRYAKTLIAENGENWDYIPPVEQITIQNVYDELTKPSERGKRLLTKANISGVWGLEFVSLATTAGKSQAYISTMLQIAEDKFIRLTADLSDAGKARISSVAEFLSSLEFNSPVAAGVNEKLIEILVEALEASPTAELSLDDLD